MDNSLFLVN